MEPPLCEHTIREKAIRECIEAVKYSPVTATDFRSVKRACLEAIERLINEKGAL